MLSLYPMKFTPVIKEKIWGGSKISTLFGLNDADDKKIGELWVLSAVENNESLVLNGHFAGNTIGEMIEVFMDDVVGEEIYAKYKNEFPLLLKLIDANDYLSVQVHPDDRIAQKKHKLLFGKSEMWYVLQADEGAGIIAGFNQPMDKRKLLKHIHEGTLKNTLNFESMKAGDMIYIPAGMVHAICPGLLIVEIQQSSDVTYRLYDWDRTNEDGIVRELHIEDAADAINFDLQPKVIRQFNPEMNRTTSMMETPFFSASLIQLNQIVEKNLEIMDAFVIFFCIEGKFDLHYDQGSLSVDAGECVLVPALTDKVYIHPKQSAKIIEILSATS
jgi:mannose-6-phosphate isomerase